MSKNFLKLNQDKTDIIIFGNPASVSVIANDLGPLITNVHDHVKNLGFIFDTNLNFEKQISTVVRGSFYHLRNIAKLKSILSFKDLETVIHAFISSRVDYCNSLYLGICQSSLSRLQLVQNAAARLLTGTKKRESITPVLASLHWLPVKYRVEFKVLLFVFKALHNLAPSYISDLLHLRSTPRVLRSSNQLCLDVPRSRLKFKGDRAFSVAAPKLWNNLPLFIRESATVDTFKSNLKIFSLSPERIMLLVVCFVLVDFVLSSGSFI